MDELIKTFSIDWKLIIAQMVNFTIVIIVLGVYALKPLTKMMAEREARIKKSLSDAEEIEKRLQEIAEQRENEIKLGRKEAQVLLAAAEKTGEELKAKKIQKTNAEVEKIIMSAKEQIAAERDLMVKEVKDELAGLVTLALDKISRNTINDKTHKKIIEKTIEEMRTADLKK